MYIRFCLLINSSENYASKSVSTSVSESEATFGSLNLRVPSYKSYFTNLQSKSAFFNAILLEVLNPTAFKAAVSEVINHAVEPG